MTSLLFFAAIVCALELARRVPLIPAFAAMSGCGNQALRLIRRRGVSDFSKERAMRILSARLFAKSARAGALLLLVASPLLLVLLVAASDQARAIGLESDWQARLWVVPMGLGYALLRWQLGRRVQPG